MKFVGVVLSRLFFGAGVMVLGLGWLGERPVGSWVTGSGPGFWAWFRSFKLK